MVTEQDRRALVMISVARAKEVDALRSQVKLLQENAELDKLRVTALVTRSVELEDSLKKCAQKRDKQKTWSLIGKGSVVLGALFVVYSLLGP